MSTLINLVNRNPQEIVNQINFLCALYLTLLKSSYSWYFRKHNTTHQLSFVNIDFLAAGLYDDIERVKVQPAFILAALALAQLMRSSTTDQGRLGMAKAMELRTQAQNALEEAHQAKLHHADLAKAQFVSVIPPCSCSLPPESLSSASRCFRIFGI